ncbi:MAG: homoserine dehydrogenase [Deltaproteobacteria bacterium]|nr:homoserine dehydrogenase [Deltaproteobacteria bacterium]MBW2305600.1 homoserine dehydrogenase [Deltaproteobacteria bacterium]
MDEEVKLGIIGFGTVGSGVVKILTQNADIIKRRLGFSLVLKSIVDIDISRDRGVSTAGIHLSTDVGEILDNPEIRIVVELVGGYEPARTFILRAMAAGKHVVTANKALLATHGEEILETARRSGVDINFEGSVGGGIPIIRALKEGLAANRMVKVFGIMNGTANYILTEMTENGESFQNVLEKAQRNGYAEVDPSLDVEGIDTAHKLSILLAMSYEMPIIPEDIFTEGITGISSQDIRYAGDFGYKIKLLGISSAHDNVVEARVHPTMIPEDAVLSKVDGVFNAFYVVGDVVGPTMYYGQGAGMMPTGSAVVGDIMELARNVRAGAERRVHPLGFETRCGEKVVQKIADLVTKHYFRFSAVDRPGVLSRISGILGDNQISIASVIQMGRELRGGAVPIVMMTHEAREADVQQALREVDQLEIVQDRTMHIRVEDETLRGGLS